MEEKNLIINENKTPFSVFEQRIDYSLVKDPKKHRRNKMKKLLSRVAIGFCSLLLLVGGVIGVYEVNEYHKRKTCPFEVGTYYYVEQVGSLNIDVEETANIVISYEKENKEDEFTVINKNRDWIIYASIYDCELREIITGELIYGEKIEFGTMKIVFTSNEKQEIEVYCYSNKEESKLLFSLRTE